MKSLQNFIAGRFQAPASEKYILSENPSTAMAHAEIPDSDERDVDQAVQAARAAFASWSKTSIEKRSQILLKLADLVDENREALARAESEDQGKPVSLAMKMDIPRVAQNFRFFATELLHQKESATRMDQGALNYALRKPIGVAGLISPWNLPLYLLSWKIAPALATGNTVVCKPSEFTSVTAWMLGDLMNQAGLPPGVCNLVFGTGAKAGSALTKHPQVPLISFTGGTKTGQEISRVTAPMLKRLSLELGGKNANLIFSDCDLEQAVATTIRSSFLNQGEICLCGSRIFVEEKIYSDFLKAFIEKTKALKVGDPAAADTFMGPLVSREHFAKVREYIQHARDLGGRIEAGGETPADLPAALSKGYFLQPTIITGLQPGCRVMQEEIFGPVVTVTPFRSDDEAIHLANDVSYGLSASVWTRNLSRAHQMAEALDVGTVWVNTWMLRDLRMPFGGLKSSGLGREGGEHSFEFFTELKTVCIQYATGAQP